MSGTVTIPASLLDDLAGLAENESYDDLAAQARALLAEQEPPKPSLRERLGPWTPEGIRVWNHDSPDGRGRGVAAQLVTACECCCDECQVWRALGPGHGVIGAGQEKGVKAARAAADAALDKYIAKREKR